MLIDCHAHLNFQAYANDRNEVINRCQNMKVINIGSQYPTSRLALELARKNKNMFASVGLHPIHVGGQEYDENEVREKVEMSDEEQLVKIKELLATDKDNRIVAVGETGLDYFHFDSKKQENKKTKKQEEVFLKHIELARGFNKPLMLHCRGAKDNPEEAYRDMLKIINYQLSQPQPKADGHLAQKAGLLQKGMGPWSKPLAEIINNYKIQGMIHCFSSTVDIAQRFINLGFYLGFTGIITFPLRRGSGSSTNAGELVNVVKQTPLNHIFTETDCPYLAPQPVRGQRNEPSYVKYIVEEIAKIKGIGYDEVITAVEENARELFGV
ncbi:TatD family hydrolase [Patescibacteria group bacterium]|nr:TatD family hydrolase [Patescibacteria group bacterium]MBU4512014.1 TatD family hydrolase [Patescibacteria group bacterium]MCG2693209.1 TatD family hydrolase [Candidatus Parcubacteria bacterium]